MNRLFKNICFGLILCFICSTSLKAQQFTLEQCVAHAFENNLQLKQSYLNKNNIEKQLEFNKNTRNPTAAITSNNSGSRGFQQVFSGNFVGEYQVVESFINQTSFNANLDLWNKRAKKIAIDKERINISISDLEIQDQKQQLHLDIIAKYYTILIAKERLQVADKIVENSKDQFIKNEKSLKLGRISVSQLNEIQTTLIQDKQTQQNERINLKKATLDLALLLQIDKNVFDVAPLLAEDTQPLSTSEINPKQMATPKIQLLEKKTQVADKDIKYAKTAYYPRLTLNYTIGSSYQQVLDAFDKAVSEQFKNNLSQTLTLGLRIPVYSQGNTRIKVQQAQINKLIAENQMAQEKEQFNNQIAVLYLDIESATETYQLAIDTEENTKKTYDFTQKRFDLGAVNLYELNYSRSQYVVSRLKTVQSKYEMMFKIKVLESYINYALTYS